MNLFGWFRIMLHFCLKIKGYMLYRYSIENFMSFRDKMELSLFPVASSTSSLDSSKVVSPLKASVIYGANASGKSNLIKSISFARNFIVQNEKLNVGNNPCFRLDTNSVNNPTIFNFEIKLGDNLYQYGFSIIFNKSFIQEEWLYELTSDKSLFVRSYNEEKGFYEFEFNIAEMTELEKSRVDVYEEDLKNAKTKLILTEFAKKDIPDSVFWSPIKQVYQWFRKLTVYFPYTRFNLLVAVDANEFTINDLYKKYFQLFNIRIDNIHLNEIPIEMLQLDEDILSEMKADLVVRENEKARKGMLNMRGQEYLFELNEYGDLTAKEVKFRHKRLDEGVADFSKSEESDGTQRLFDLIPALARLIKQEGVFIIDEIDRSLHSLLTKQIIEFFLSKSKEVNSQLICTTHEVLLLDLALLLPEEIWFVRKSKDGISKLYPLAQYKIKFPENVRENYLLGRYRGIPEF